MKELTLRYYKIRESVKKLKVLLVIVLLILPLLLVAQETTATSTIHQNTGFASMLAQLLPMGINPYATVFLTTVFSKFGLENQYVATNPFFDSWIVLLIFGGLFLFTSLVGTVFKTNKATAAIGLADNYLSGHAAIIINVFVILAPTFFTSSETTVLQEASFLSVSLKTLAILIVSIYFLVVVSSVRFFIDILIFLSPIPLIDSILEITKIVVTFFFVLLAAIFPMTSAVIAVIIFLFSLVFYKRSIRSINQTKYLFVYPILNFFKHELEMEETNFSIPVLIKVKTKKFKKGTVVQLKKDEGKVFLEQERFLAPNKKEVFNVSDCFIQPGQLKSKITNDSGSILILLNTTYYRYIPAIAAILNIPIAGEAFLNIESEAKTLTNLKQLFDGDDHQELKASL